MATLKMRPIVMLMTVVVAGSAYFLFSNLKAELAPIEDRGSVHRRCRA